MEAGCGISLEKMPDVAETVSDTVESCKVVEKVLDDVSGKKSIFCRNVTVNRHLGDGLDGCGAVP